MLMVLALHVNFFCFEGPTKSEIIETPVQSFARIFFEALTISAVNIFVMISGWFGIKASARGLFSFLFQCFYFTLGLFGVFYLFGDASIDFNQVACATTMNNWFVVAYIGLYLISPVLNAFIKIATRRQIELFLLSFFCYEMYYGWIGLGHYYSGGYSVVAFIGLYIFSRYLNLYGRNLGRFGLPLFVAGAIGTILMYYLVQFTNPLIVPYELDYYSPFVIMSAAGMILWCSTWQLRPAYIINFIAASAFAVYLFHFNYNILEPYYLSTIRNMSEQYNGILYFAMLLLMIISTYIIALILDQPRKLLWRFIAARFFAPKKSAQVVASSE